MSWVIIIMVAVLALEVPAILCDKAHRELLCFSILWVLAFVYASLVALKLPLPTVLEVLKYVYSQVNYFPQ